MKKRGDRSFEARATWTVGLKGGRKSEDAGTGDVLGLRRNTAVCFKSAHAEVRVRSRTRAGKMSVFRVRLSTVDSGELTGADR